MANAIYPKYKEAILSGGTNTDLVAGTVKVILIDAADYTYDAAHDFLNDVAGAARVATGTIGATKTVTDGTFKTTTTTTFSGVSGDQSEALIIYIDTGVESTSRLVAYIDTGVTGLPVTPNSGDITITWNASGIFTI
jgi:hypothetical protein